MLIPAVDEHVQVEEVLCPFFPLVIASSLGLIASSLGLRRRLPFAILLVLEQEYVRKVRQKLKEKGVEQPKIKEFMAQAPAMVK